jgi:hypothetical protein
MSDLKWFGNTEYDTKSGFVFHKTQPNSSMGCKGTLDRIPYFNSPLLLQEYNIDFSFYNMKLMKLF